MTMLSKLLDRITGEEAEISVQGDSSEVRKLIIDVGARLDQLAEANPEELEWKRSIVDLLKLVGMDSSYGSRKMIAFELGYTQAEVDRKGSAEMNQWIHRKVMKLLASRGAKIPDGLVD